ncbi:MAG: hypothetical protein AB7G17_02290 [Phycisphaerales bacterium]
MQREDESVPTTPRDLAAPGGDARARVEHTEIVEEFDGVCSTRHVKVWERRRESGETVRGSHELGRVAEPMS